MLLLAGLGVDPWDVLHQGLAGGPACRRHRAIIAGALVLLLWIPLRQRPGLGTLSQRRADRAGLNRTSPW